MGCGSSRDMQEAPLLRIQTPGNIRASHVNVQLGENVKPFSANGPNMVFVFGGPGSGKGHVISELKEWFPVEVISCDLLVLEELPRKVSRAITLQSTRDVNDLIRQDPSHISLPWLLSLVQQRIHHHDNRGGAPLFLVDLLPSLQWMVTNSNLSNDCYDNLLQFESQNLISFGIHFYLDQDSLHKARRYCHHGNLSVPQGATMADEADNSRTKRRFLSHQSAVLPFLKYFKDVGRLATIDVSSGDYPLITKTIVELLDSLKLLSWKLRDAVIVFAIDGMVIGELNLSTIPMATVVTMETIIDKASSLEEQLYGLRQHLHHMIQSDGVHYIVVDTARTKLTNQITGTTVEDKRHSTVSFQQQHTAPLPWQHLNTLAIRDYFKSFYSNGCTLLYPIATSNNVCNFITYHVTNSNTE